MSTRVLITGALHESAIAQFQKKFECTYLPDCTREQVLAEVKNTHVLVTRSETDVDKAVIDAGKNLRLIARAAVGVGNIDIDYATSKGILVVNCPAKNTNSAAELTFGLLLAMLRNVPQAHQHLKSGGWDRHRFSGRELKGKRLGIVGLGNVGHRVAKFAHGFDMEVFAFDPYIAPQIFQRYGAQRCETLGELVDAVDILSVHVPLNKETKNMIDGAMLDRLPKGKSYVLNAARGGVIHEQHLLERLNSGHITAAAIDTWENEPKPLAGLLQHKNVWVTPHIGASTEEAQLAIGQTIYEQVVKFIDGSVVDHPVNLPSVGVIDNPLLKAYAVLAEKLGSLAGQILSFNPSVIQVQYRGDLATLSSGLIRLALMKGYAGHKVEEFVSFVNVESLFQRLGIVVQESQEPDFGAYRSALKVVVSDEHGRSLAVGGVVFDQRYVRLSLINDFYFEVEPSGSFILVENLDVPGVVGDVGRFLASRNINIDSFDLSRNRKGGRAMALIKIDGELSAEAAQAMRAIANVVAVHGVAL